MKIKCSKCKQLKETSEFYKKTGREFNVGGYCKPCRKKADNERRFKKKEGTIKAF